MSITYRPEIDGLRAIAVVPVVLFHAGVQGFSGGYVGVDIFFVISGYLITSILIKDLRGDKFSIKKFYERRIRRIFPALFLVTFVSSIIGFWLLIPSELEEYGRSLAASTLFLANYFFMFEAGYFTGPAETKPLLHLWSLGVEEQFYVLFPIYLYFGFRLFGKKLVIVTAALLVLSLLYSLLLVEFRSEDAFYSTPARAWELLIGSMIAILGIDSVAKKTLGNVISSLGLIAICLSVVFYTEATVFPGYSALLPVLGSAAIIVGARSGENWVGKLLSLEPMRVIGLISFSLYLWHWPVLVFYSYWNIEPVGQTATSLLLLFMVLLSYLSWRFVESPFRTKSFLSSQSSIFAFGAVSMTVFLAVGAALLGTAGFPDRLDPEATQFIAAKADAPEYGSCETDPTTDLNICTLGTDPADQPQFVLWGDSHAAAILPALDQYARNQEVAGLYVGRDGCVPLVDVYQARQGYEDCSEANNKALSLIAENESVRHVVLASRWALYVTGERFRNEKGEEVYIQDNESTSVSFAENERVFSSALNRTLLLLRQQEKEIVFVNQIPETEYDIPFDMARAKMLGRELEFRPSLDDYNDRQSAVSELAGNLETDFDITFVSAHERQCEAGMCAVQIDGQPIYRDSNHITETYAFGLHDLFQSALAR